MTSEPDETPHRRRVFRIASWLDVTQFAGFAIAAVVLLWVLLRL